MVTHFANMKEFMAIILPTAFYSYTFCLILSTYSEFIFEMLRD